jgi:hypothetical protein
MKTVAGMVLVAGMKLPVTPGYAAWTGTKLLEDERPAAGATPFDGTTDLGRVWVSDETRGFIDRQLSGIDTELSLRGWLDESIVESLLELALLDRCRGLCFRRPSGRVCCDDGTLGDFMARARSLGGVGLSFFTRFVDPITPCSLALSGSLVRRPLRRWCSAAVVLDWTAASANIPKHFLTASRIVSRRGRLRASSWEIAEHMTVAASKMQKMA